MYYYDTNWQMALTICNLSCFSVNSLSVNWYRTSLAKAIIFNLFLLPRFDEEALKPMNGVDDFFWLLRCRIHSTRRWPACRRPSPWVDFMDCFCLWITTTFRHEAPNWCCLFEPKAVGFFRHYLMRVVTCQIRQVVIIAAWGRGQEDDGHNFALLPWSWSLVPHVPACPVPLFIFNFLDLSWPASGSHFQLLPLALSTFPGGNLHQCQPLS